MATAFITNLPVIAVIDFELNFELINLDVNFNIILVYINNIDNILGYESQQPAEATTSDPVSPPSAAPGGAEIQSTDEQPVGSSATETTSSTDISISSATTDGAAGDITSILPTPEPTGSSLGSESSGAELSDTNQAVTANAVNTSTTVVVAGGVVGGVVFLALIAFLIWYWRKRSMKKRRSTLLTPLSSDPNYRGDEKGGPYIINRSSLGPTSLPVKLGAAIGAKYRRLRGRVNDLVTRSASPSPSVNLDRGNSQFGPPSSPPSRSNSRPREAPGGGPTQTGKGRFVDWWDRLTEDADFNWRLRSEARNSRAVDSPLPAPHKMKDDSSAPMLGSQQPDFLTLLSMDDKQLEREAARGRGRGSSRSISEKPRRRSISLGNEGHFLGGLGLSFDNANPFSDQNAMDHGSAKPMPLTVSSPTNPFSDANAIAGPANPAPAAAAGGYVREIRRSRGYSVNSIGRPGESIIYRESGASVESFGTRRHKFRSDPFDLDRPELLQGSSSSENILTGGLTRGASTRSNRSNRGPLNTPRQAHLRSESYSSKYSSGVSMGDWSDPGPDVGPAARWTPSPVSRASSGIEGRRQSRQSEGSVGKAL
ncbi:hypothetical protein F5B20DRAFT_578268 [Whalleya microplaca]|nr:hypothetical protein F5B20DRAFT_578268 [Whalleya microplaca]